ncbi:hypothetical protein V1477_012044 [Vespula maculifrons]|uniref:Uncharacterized protein n=1 Tax=Vespula maculifrons TaxID=7453 RepID=A0ABD2C1G6_VESMC
MTDVQTNSTKEDAASKRLQQDDSTFRTANEKVWQTQIQRLSETVMKISRRLVPVNATISRSGSFVEIPTCQHVINRVWPINEHLSYATSSSNYNRVDSATMSKNRQNSEFSDR